MYHAIHDENSVISISPAIFEWQMGWLHAHGFQVYPLSEVVNHLQEGIPFPLRSISITFDDGFESVYHNAFPILQRFGFTATIFLVAGYIGQYNDWESQPKGLPRFQLANWPQIQEMFGSHTISHPRLDLVDHEQLEEEIIVSKMMIEDKLGHPVDIFSYPYGRYDLKVKTIISQKYQGACSTKLGLVTNESDLLEMERVEVFYIKSPFLFQWMATPLFSKYLGLRRMARAGASKLIPRQWN
jgi:peptidoglycan/xylan/chitin deacetylase (PgdA/CDA1 family)